MEATEAIITRRSTRRFTGKLPARECLEQILTAGRHAPSGGNSQTTHFILITNREILAELERIVKEEFSVMEETPGMYRSFAHAIRASKTERYLYDYEAPVLIITANQKDYGNNMADCACALENMMIAANALDLGSCYINQLRWLNENEKLLSKLYELGMLPEERVYGALAVGYADTKDGLPVRTPLERTGNPVTYIE